jgi:hypothetical protein
MHWLAYRLALEDSPLASVAAKAREAAKGRYAGAEACVAYQSSELAAMCTPELLWNVRRRTDMIRETIQLPAGAGLHEAVPVTRFGPYDVDVTDMHAAMAYLRSRDLLSIWLPCAAAPAQHAVLLNPLHPGFSSLVVEQRALVHTRPMWSGQLQVAEDTSPYFAQSSPTWPTVLRPDLTTA